MTGSKILATVVDLLYPRFCVQCGKMGEFFCEKCQDDLDFSLELNLLGRLAHNLPAGEKVYLDQLQAVGNYNPYLAKVMLKFKYEGVKDLAEPLSHWLYQYLPLPEVDVITYIPLHRKRLAERGYNQAELLARGVAEKLGRTCQAILERTVAGQKLSFSKDKKQRLALVERVFAAKAKITKVPARVLLVDDIVTTGATMNQAARVLKELGVRQVFGVAVAHGA